jgi:hypothetical protein
MAIRFDYNYVGVGEYMRTDPALAAGLHARADLALAFAKSIAPVGTPEESDHHPGHYRDSLEVRGPVGFRDRVGFTIETDADYAPAVEAHHHTLAATVAAFSDPHGGEGL